MSNLWWLVVSSHLTSISHCIDCIALFFDSQQSEFEDILTTNRALMEGLRGIILHCTVLYCTYHVLRCVVFCCLILTSSSVIDFSCLVSSHVVFVATEAKVQLTSSIGFDQILKCILIINSIGRDFYFLSPDEFDEPDLTL